MAIASISFAPWVPTRKRDLQRIFQLANFKDGETFYELGCGDGTVIINAAKQFQVKAVGLEIALPLYIVSKLRQFFSKNKNVKIKFKNLFKEDLSQADIIFIFGMPKPLAGKLREKLQKELKPGARVISYVFPIAGLTPVKIDKPNEKEVAIYLYEF